MATDNLAVTETAAERLAANLVQDRRMWLDATSYEDELRYNTYLLMCQKKWWRNIDDIMFELADIEYSWLNNLAPFLERNAWHYGRRAARDLERVVEVLYGVQESQELTKTQQEILADAVEVAATILEDPAAWTVKSPLYEAILSERNRRIHDPEILATLPTQGERELYLELMEVWPEDPSSAAVICKND